MIIKVKQSHIRKGKTSSPWHCPVALAIREQTNLDIGVIPDAVKLYSYPNELPIPLPDSARDFIRAFDTSKPVKPFSFDLPLTSPAEPEMGKESL